MDDRGSLVVIENGDGINFDIQRIYFLSQFTGGQSRGFHAHRDLKQLLICLKGRCEVTCDNGTQRETAVLDNPTHGLVIGPMIWREMHNFSQDCVLLAVASQKYDEGDYIRDYKMFIKEAKNAEQ